MVIIIQTFSPLDLRPQPRNGKRCSKRERGDRSLLAGCSLNIIYLIFPCVRLLVLSKGVFFLPLRNKHVSAQFPSAYSFPTLTNVSQCAHQGNYVVLSTVLPRITRAYLKFRLIGGRL